MDSQRPVRGTVHLVDVQGDLDSKHLPGSRKNGIVLVPAPSDDSEDPLNWSAKRKGLASASICLYVTLRHVVPLAKRLDAQ